VIRIRSPFFSASNYCAPSHCCDRLFFVERSDHRDAQTRRKRYGCYGQEVDPKEGLEEEGQEEVEEVLEEEGFEKEKGFTEEEVTFEKALPPIDRFGPLRRFDESPLTRAFVLMVGLLLPVGCASAARGAGEARLPETLVRLLADPSLRHSGSALLVVSLDRGDTLYAREIDRLYTPASNLKLFTAASALHVLGPDFRFETTLAAARPWARDTLPGDLYLIGRGDPDLVTADLAALADSVVADGVRVVLGRVVPVADHFAGPEWGPGWMWDDGPYWYWPYTSALTLNDNSVTVRVTPGPEVGAPVMATLDPPTDYVRLTVEARTAQAGSEPTLQVERHWSPKANAIDVRGNLPLDAKPVTEVRTVEDPAAYAARVLTELLTERGVAVLASPPGAASPAPVDPIVIGRHRSDSLAVSVRNFLKVSDNLTGEQLVKAIGAKAAGPPGDYAKGLAAERRFLAREVGIDTTSMVLADGSGVSRYNLVTARQVVDLLAYMAGRQDLAPAFLSALPIAGVDGTLEDRMRGTAAERRARAKTGSLSGVSALSGYVMTAGGERLAFSLMMEFFPGSTAPPRAVQDSVVAALAGVRR
jgi:D-alanyl-D-alanine carboxypeptidase/D-alanyl-D-alanine-endopeptidase (penicillin-binding protein 4)